MKDLLCDSDDSEADGVIESPQGVTVSVFENKAEFEFKLPVRWGNLFGFSKDFASSFTNEQDREREILERFPDYCPYGYSFQPPELSVLSKQSSSAQKIPLMERSAISSLTCLFLSIFIGFPVYSFLRCSPNCGMLFFLFILFMFSFPIVRQIYLFWSMQKNGILLRVLPTTLEIVYGKKLKSYVYARRDIKNVFYEKEKINMNGIVFDVYTCFAEIEGIGRIELVSGITNSELPSFITEKILSIMNLNDEPDDKVNVKKLV